jgi:hypothetical protein
VNSSGLPSFFQNFPSRFTEKSQTLNTIQKIHKVSLHPLSKKKKKDLFAKRKFSGQKIYLKNKRQNMELEEFEKPLFLFLFGSMACLVRILLGQNWRGNYNNLENCRFLVVDIFGLPSVEEIK